MHADPAGHCVDEQQRLVQMEPPGETAWPKRPSVPQMPDWQSLSARHDPPKGRGPVAPSVRASVPLSVGGIDVSGPSTSTGGETRSFGEPLTHRPPEQNWPLGHVPTTPSLHANGGGSEPTMSWQPKAVTASAAAVLAALTQRRSRARVLTGSLRRSRAHLVQDPRSAQRPRVTGGSSAS